MFEFHLIRIHRKFKVQMKRAKKNETITRPDFD